MVIIIKRMNPLLDDTVTQPSHFGKDCRLLLLEVADFFSIISHLI